DPSHYYIYRDSGQTNVRYSYFPTTTAVSNQGGKKLTVKDQITGKIIAAKTSSSGLYITDPATKSNPLSVKNILVIGDSTTDSDTWVDEFGRRLTGAGGSPAGYEWTNYNFIGTNTDGTYNHEGRSGWTFEDFAYAPDDATHGRSEVTTNPFWNSGTASLDFAKYMTDNSFSGDIDYCVILLGWNDGLSLARTATTVGETAELFIDALHADYPNCKVLLCGINTSSPYPFNGTTLIPPYSLNKYALELAKVYDALASDATYSTFVKYVPVTACFDAEYGMQHSNVVANARTAETIRTCTDLIHPGASGYLQIADIVLATFLTLV
ncbi:MAG TPA: SGNH/GDSL hydrolase family protein, partial [Candidatus Omnitrophota bacterium]|nr:SGNH/GDSL hydrolase family protein [Candidatus Omnitrophota bacterium]